MYGDIILRDNYSGEWWQFTNPIDVIEIKRYDELKTTLHSIENAVIERQLYAVGFVTYEASRAIDEAMTTHAPNQPLAWFGLYEKATPFQWDDFQVDTAQNYTMGEWHPDITEADFSAAIDTIKAAIARGETYQVNYTFRLHATFSGCVRAFFSALQQAQMGAYGAFVDLGDMVICSASPELFFALDGDQVNCCPMKGTAPRGLTWEDDQDQIGWLAQSSKNQAENVMIVDMIRNDLGQIAEIGTVKVSDLFDITRYPTVLQMTSTVQAKTSRPWADIMTRLFPCASITGAPKIKTMQLIRDLESTPRGVYTGAIGYLAPDRKSQFNVAIRTVVIDRANKMATYGTGGGITWDSDAADEYAEAIIKTGVLQPRPTFHLIETVLWRPESGLWLLDAHLDRLETTAAYFRFIFNRDMLRQKLKKITVVGDNTENKVRILLFADGTVKIESEPLVAISHISSPPMIGFAHDPIDRSNLFLYHKTSQRDVYKIARASRPSCQHVLLWNDKHEVTEATYANIIFEIDGQLVTPALSSGLLAGVLRRKLLADGVISERVIMKHEVYDATRLWLINSVRGRWQVKFDQR